MKNAKMYFIFVVFLYVVLLFLTIKGPSPSDPWEVEWLMQVIGLALLSSINLILVRVFLKENPTQQAIITRLSLTYYVAAFLSFLLVIGF